LWLGISVDRLKQEGHEAAKNADEISVRMKALRKAQTAVPIEAGWPGLSFLLESYIAQYLGYDWRAHCRAFL
jgi:hypothetical protein